MGAGSPGFHFPRVDPGGETAKKQNKVSPPSVGNHLTSPPCDRQLRHRLLLVLPPLGQKVQLIFIYYLLVPAAAAIEQGWFH